MVKLTPIRLPDGSSMRYAARDPIGVEKLADSKRRGWNAVAHWVARAREVLEVEHDSSGRHDTIKIPRGYLLFDGSPRPASPPAVGSYLQRSSLTSASLSFLATGRYLVSWDPLPWGDIAIVGGEPGTATSAATAGGCQVDTLSVNGLAEDRAFSLLIFGA